MIFNVIIQRGVWHCFHCGQEYPNTVLQCSDCNATRKHTENMRASLGMDGGKKRFPEGFPKRGRGEKIQKNRDLYAKYKRCTEKLEAFLMKFFPLGVIVKTLKENEKKQIYYGFTEGGYHYTIRRDKI